MVALLREGRLTPTTSSTTPATSRPTSLYSGFYMQAPTTRSRRRRRCWRTSGTTSSSRASRRWRSGRATTCRSREPCSAQLVEEFVRKNVLMTGSIWLGGRKVDLANDARQRAQRDGRARQRRAASRRRADHADRRRPGRREELRLPGGHVTFGTGRSAVKHTMPRLAEWIIAHSDDARTEERDGVPADRAGRRAGARALLRAASPRPTARSSRRTSTTPTWSPPGRVPGPRA